MEKPYCEECYDSPTGESSSTPSAEVHCRVVGTWDKFTAYELVMNWVAGNRVRENDCPLDSVKLEPVEGTDAWNATLHYSPRKRKAGDSFDYQFTTTGGTSHITRSFKTYCAKSCIRDYPVIDFKNGIGYNDNTFEGCDINTPAFSWSQSVCWPLAFVNVYYKKLLARYTCCVNDSPFAGFDAGEVRFDGITNGSIENETDEETGLLYYYYKLTYAFSAQPNMTDLEVGDSGTFTKRGWDYMWTTRIRVDDQKTGNTLQLPRQVNVEQVYPYVNLNALGLDFAMFLNLLRN